MTKGRVLALVGAVSAAIAFMVMAGSAAAQYPPPEGSLLCSSSELSGGTKSYVFSATLTRTDGSVVVGETVSFSISGNASLNTSAAVTDGNGTARVIVDTHGKDFAFTVTALRDGLRCQASAQQRTPPPEVRIIETRGVSVIAPPKTGDAGLAGSNEDSSKAAYAAGGLLVAIGFGGIGWLAARRHIA